ncbi:MAG: TonB-dependent receptor, partial [Saprospiraceae bacterium]|nr:TonB-dependent receptor [Saprospiraceae bacterium]
RLPKKFKMEVEVYYKKMSNLINNSEGAQILNDCHDNVNFGEGSSYGLEFMLSRREGPVQGWMGYTLSWTDRRFDRINFGRPYPYHYDRRHNLTLALSWKVNNWLEATANWLFGTGLATSIPLQQYVIYNSDISSTPIVATDYGQKNGFRLPVYQRLDLGLNAKFRGKIYNHCLQVGVYNMYDRKNPLYYDLRTRLVNEDNALKQERAYVQVWLLPVLPTFSYSIEF